MVLARSAEQISFLLKAAQAHRVPVTVRGGGLTTEGLSLIHICCRLIAESRRASVAK